MRCEITYWTGDDHSLVEPNQPTKVTVTAGMYFLEVTDLYYADKEIFKRLIAFLIQQADWAEQDAAEAVRRGIKDLLGIKEAE